MPATLSNTDPQARSSAEPHHPYSRALDTANPRFSGEWQPLSSPPGHMPGLNEFRNLPGCRFAPRCASAVAACLDGPPAMREVANGITVRCIRNDAVPASEPVAGVKQPAASNENSARLLKVESVSKTFHRGGLFRPRSETHAVRDVSFSIAAGEFVGVVGESGSGKSTLGRMIMGLERPTAGQILLDGEPLGHDASEWRRRIGSIQLVFQDPRSALNPRRNVLNLVTQPMQSTHQSRRDMLERATLLLQDTGLPKDVASRLPHQMSGGQRQRVNIARALCAMPRLLIADEIASDLYDVSVRGPDPQPAAAAEAGTRYCVADDLA